MMSNELAADLTSLQAQSFRPKITIKGSSKIRLLISAILAAILPKPREMVWINPAKLSSDGSLPGLSFYRPEGSLIRMPGGELYLVSKYGPQKLSRANAEALTKREQRKTAVLVTLGFMLVVVSVCLALVVVQ